MKLLLNGATGGTNFGDYLFAEIFQKEAAKQIKIENIYWYDSRYALSDFYKRNLKYNKKYRLSEIDALICISGGYFCGDDRNFKNYIIRYLMYFHICLRCILRKIPIAIIGVEVGKSKSFIIDKIQKFILNRANLVVVRNEESMDALSYYGVKSGVCTADTAHTILSTLFDGKGVAISFEPKTDKRLYFHVQMSALSEAKRLIPALNAFLKKHAEYSVFVGTDQYIADETPLFNLLEKINCEKKEVTHYAYPPDLCSLLDRMDFIITPKLHVGIVGATFSKSVVSFSVHTEKIRRFYNQLHEVGRSLPMAEFDDEKALRMLEYYCDKPIHVPQDIMDAAYKNIEYLHNFISDVAKKNKTGR